MDAKAGDRVRDKTKKWPGDGRVESTYKGMTTGTPYALVLWSDRSLHVSKQADLEPAVETVP